MDIILCFNDYSSVVKAVGVNNGGGGKTFPQTWLKQGKREKL